MPTRRTPTNLVNAAIAAEQEGRPAKACQLLRMAAAEHHRPGEVHLRLGRILAGRGRHQEAFEALGEAAKHGADAAAIDQAIGASLLALGKYEEAREAADRARRRRPDFAAAHLDAGRASEALEDLDRAVACYQAATVFVSQDPEAWRLLASVLRRKGDYAGAAAALATAVQWPHGSLFLWSREVSPIGEEVRELLKQSGPAQSIVDCLQHALEAKSIAPDQATKNWLTWAEMLIGAGRRDLALQTYSMLLRELARAAEPGVAFRLGHSLANFAVTDDKPEDRAQEIEAALRESSAPAALTSWWSSLYQQPDPPPQLRERAVGELLKLLEEKPEQRELYDFLWNAANEEALVQRIGETAEHWDSTEARLTWAEALLAAGRVESAAHELRRIDSESLSRDQRLRWAQALFNGGLAKEALRQLQRCLEGCNVADGLGEAWWLGSALKSAVDLGPEISAIRALVERCGNPAAMARLAELLAACERDDEAEGLAQAALTLDPDASGPYEVLEKCWKRRRPSAAKRRTIVDVIEERGGLAGGLQAGRLLHTVKDDAANRLLRRAAEGYEAEAGKPGADAELAKHLLTAADAWLELKDFDHAFGAFERAAEFDPDRYATYESWTRSFGRFDEESGLIATLRREVGLARLSRDFDDNWREQRPFSETHGDGVKRLVEGIRRDCDYEIAYLANQLLRQRRTEAALDVCRHACGLFPSDAGAARDLGAALFHCGRFAEAFAQQAEAARVHAQAVTSLDEGALHLRLQISRAQAQAAAMLDQLQEACSILEEGLAGLLPAPGSPMASEAAETYLDLAGYLSARQNHEKAQDKVAAALKLQPGNPRAMFMHAMTSWDDQDVATALELLERLSKSDPDGVSAERGTWATYASHNTAYLLEIRGRYALARRQCQDAAGRYLRRMRQNLQDRNPWECVYFAWVSQRAGYEPAATEKLLRSATLLQPDLVEAHVSLVSFFADRRKQERDPEARSRLVWEGRRHYRAACDLLENRLQQARTIGTLLVERGKDQLPAEGFDRAQKNLVEAHDLGENSAEPATLLLQRGKLHLLVGEIELAEKDLAKAHDLGEDSAELQAALGEVAMARQRFKSAVRHFDQAIGRRPSDLDRRTALAQAHFKSGELERAEAEFTRVLEVTRFHVDSLAGLAELYITMADERSASGGASQDDLYGRAVELLDEALGVVASDNSPKVYGDEERARYHYLRGYAAIRRYEGSRLGADSRLVDDALHAFETSEKLAHDKQRAQRAIARIKDQVQRMTPRSWLERSLPYAVSVLAAVIFVTSTIVVLKGRPVWVERVVLGENAVSALAGQELPSEDREAIEAAIESIKGEPAPDREVLWVRLTQHTGDIDLSKLKPLILRYVERNAGTWERESVGLATYAMLAFGSLLFMVAGASLPYLRSLKVGQFQLERGETERIETTRSFGISR